MELKDENELANTRHKLAELEARYDELRRDGADIARARDATLRSLKRYINQFQEEIARYECRCNLNGAESRVSGPRDIQSDSELENTRSKLNRLEELLESKCDGGGEELRRAERISLKRLINQFKEEIARYEAHQLVK